MVLCGEKMACLVLRDNIKHLNPARLRRRFFRLEHCFSVRRFNTKTSSFEEDCGIEFNQNQRLFESKTSGELARSLFVLKLSSYDIFVKNSLPLMAFAEKILGTRLFESLMKKTMYSQFVAGEDYNSIKKSIKSLKEHGIGTILCVPTEEDYTQDTDEFEGREALFDRNSEVIHDCISKTDTGSFSQMRISAICSPSVLKTLSDLIHPYEAQINKPVGLTIKNIARGFDDTILSHVLVPHLTENQNKHLKRSLQRLDSFAQHCKSKNVKLLIDAEQSYLEGGIHRLILALQSKYNRRIPWVYGTYQCYRKDTLDQLKCDLKLMSDEAFHFGAKLVRGAYRQQEKTRSVELGYENPIHSSYEETGESYDAAIEIILQRVASSPAEVMLATHNEESIQLATNRMRELGIGKKNGVSFAQLYGMCDQVSYLLGNKDYDVYKSVPYGAINTTLPYLARRALENRDVTSRTAKERSLIWKEIRYRFTSPLTGNYGY